MTVLCFICGGESIAQYKENLNIVLSVFQTGRLLACYPNMEVGLPNECLGMIIVGNDFAISDDLQSVATEQPWVPRNATRTAETGTQKNIFSCRSHEGTL